MLINGVSGRDWIIYRGPGFHAAVLFLTPPTTKLFHPLPSVNLTGDTKEEWERETTCWREKGEEGIGEEPNQTIRRWRESLVHYKSFNTLWSAKTASLNVLLNGERSLKALTDHFGGGSGLRSSLIWSLFINWRLGNFFLLILKGFHHKISKKPIDAA